METPVSIRNVTCWPATSILHFTDFLLGVQIQLHNSLLQSSKEADSSTWLTRPLSANLLYCFLPCEEWRPNTADLLYLVAFALEVINLSMRIVFKPYISGSGRKSLSDRSRPDLFTQHYSSHSPIDSIYKSDDSSRPRWLSTTKWSPRTVPAVSTRRQHCIEISCIIVQVDA